jgi:hypothetical protein
MRAWASERGLLYEPLGLLPPASDFLHRGLGMRGEMHHAPVQSGRGGIISYRNSKLRPARFSENVCSGTLPGGVEGTLCQHAYLGFAGHGEGDPGYAAVCDTIVLVRLPEGARLTRGLVGRAQRTRGKNIVLTKREYRDDTKELEPSPALRERTWFEVDADEETRPLAGLFDPDVVATFEAAPELARVCMREGWLTVELPEIETDPAVLDSLCRLAAVLVVAARREAARLPGLEPGAGPVPPPPSTPYTQYLDRGVAQVRWDAPPPDVKTAGERYLAVTKDDPHAARRGRRGFGFFVALFAVIGLPFAAIAWIAGSPSAAIAAMVVMLALGVGLGALARRSVRHGESVERAQAWGREAFAREHARSRGLRIEDAEELRRRLLLPFPGRPERSQHGDLGGVDGRIVWWRDRSDPDTGDRAMMLAPVPAPAGDPAAPTSPHRLERAGDWLVVVHDLGTGARTVAGADALRADAVRLARAG